jgi:hypothetical protein
MPRRACTSSRLLLAGDVVTFNTDISQIRSEAGY